MPLKIGYDLSILETPFYTGVEKLACCLFSEFWKSYPEIENIVYCRKTPERLNSALPDNVSIAEVPGGRFWRYRELPAALKKSGIDCFVSPVTALPLQRRIPMIAYIHECQWRHPCGERYMLSHRLALWSGALRARMLITNSVFTQNDIKAELGRFCPETMIVPPAGDNSLSEISPVSDDELFRVLGKKLDRPFALFVSTVRAKKNIGMIIDAFKKMEMKDAVIVIAGRILDKSFPDAAKGCGNIIFTDYVDNRVLKALYLKAGVFVYISANEGFGLPILEAFKHELPVIGVNKASIPEVAGNGALLMDELSAEKLSEKILMVLSDKAFADKLKDGMHCQLEKYTWEKSAGKLYTAIESVLNNCKR